ncbi:MAG TPA: FUSC family protein [Sporichthyaceae bacterium]|nr:FUSC family protein [Sporichthyaceae bacterium]
MIDRRDVTGPLPRVPRDAAEIRRRGEVLLDEVAARSRADLRARLARLRIAAPLIAQSAVAAGGAWYLARLIGRGSGPPFFAPVAAVVSIGSALGQRLRRTVELVLGVSLGVGIGDVIARAIGNGTAALVVIVALAMAAAVLLDGGQLLVMQAGTSSVLVATLLPSGGGIAGLDRCGSALIGGGVGILVSLVLMPLNPLRVARAAVDPVLDGTSRGLEATADALAAADTDAGLAALHDLRALNPAIVQMSTALATCAEIARVAPIRWRSRDRFESYATAAPQLDYAVRNARVLARRATVLLRTEHSCPPQLVESVRLLAQATRRVGAWLGEGTEPRECRGLLVETFAQARAATRPDSPEAVIVMIAQLRSVAYDLLRATGLDRVQALELLEG